MLKCVVKHFLSEWSNIKVNLLVKTCLRNEIKEYNIRGIYSNNSSEKDITSNEALRLQDKNRKNECNRIFLQILS